MTWNRAIRWIMIVSGILTASMLYAAVAPQAAMRATFGATVDGPLAEILVRNWGVLVGLVGAMLLYGAFNSPVRRLVLAVAAASKAVFIALLVIYGQAFLTTATPAIAIDAVSVTLFVAYLATSRGDGDG